MELKDYSIQELSQAYAAGKTIIGFGAGKSLDSFCRMFPEECPERFLEAVADNNRELYNTYREIGNARIPIYSIDMIIEKYGRVDIIVVTSLYLQAICDQLASIPALEHTIVCFYGFLIDGYSDWKLREGISECPIVHEEKYEIPKNIHYCWFGRSKIPEKYKTWMESWKKYCPDFEIVEWNEDNYDVYKNDYMAEAYEAKRWGFVPDFARLDIIYQYGGIYLDTDVEILKDLTPLLHQQGFCGFQDEYYVALGLGFGAVSHHPCILAMLKDYENQQFINRGKINLTSSPVYQSNVLEGIGLKRNGAFQTIQGLHVYPKHFFSPMNHYNRRIMLHPMTFTIHHFDGSWVDTGIAREWKSFPAIYDAMHKEILGSE